MKDRNTCEYKNMARIQYEYEWDENGQTVVNTDMIQILPCPCIQAMNICNEDNSINAKEFEKEPYENIQKLMHKNCYYFSNGKCKGNINNISNIEVSLGFKCNTKCKMCGISCQSNQDDIDAYKNILEKLKGNELDTLSFSTFGDQFSHEWTEEFLESITLKDFKKVNFVTNAINLNKDKLERIYKMLCAKGIEIILTISFHSFNKDTNELIMPSGKFENIIETIKFAYSIGILKSINYVIQKSNINEYMYADAEAEKIANGLSSKLTYIIDIGSISKEKECEIKEFIGEDRILSCLL